MTAATTVECPACLRDVEIPAGARAGDTIWCPYCKLWFRLMQVDGVWSGERIKTEAI